MGSFYNGFDVFTLEISAVQLPGNVMRRRECHFTHSADFISFNYKWRPFKGICSYLCEINADMRRLLMTIQWETAHLPACLIILRSLWPVISRVSLALKMAKDHVHHFTTPVSQTRNKSRSISLSGQGQQRKTFFSVFYLCINGGSLLSTIITPILRGRYERDIKFMASGAIKNVKVLEKWVKDVCLLWQPTLVSSCSSGMRLQREAGMLPSGLRCPRGADGGCPGYYTCDSDINDSAHILYAEADADDIFPHSGVYCWKWDVLQSWAWGKHHAGCV